MLRAHFHSTPLRFTFLALGAFGLGGVALTDAACTTDTAVVTVAPVTGVVVRSNALVAGIGCGTGDAQIFGYAAIVYSQESQEAGASREPPQGGALISAGTYPCYADAIFVNLPFAQGGLSSFGVKVVGFSKAAFDAFPVDVTAGAIDKPAGDDKYAVVDEARLAMIASLEAASTWTTACSANEQPNVEVLADCDPLAPHVAP